jgi:GntR family transcriptional regulator
MAKFQFHIQSDSDIPASKQLFDQLHFAIASRQFPPGSRLPSTRQMAMITGLHRNTISKVYQQLEDKGLVSAQAGSGIYVQAQGHERGAGNLPSQHPSEAKIIQKSIDRLLAQGLSLSQARELFLAEIDWRMRCSARVLVTVPAKDIGVGELMMNELENTMGVPVQLVTIEDLPQILEQTVCGTVVTSRYFIKDVEAIAGPKSVRVIPVDIYDYTKEMELIKALPANTCIGIVSLSAGIIKIAEVIVHSLRGEDLLVLTAQARNTAKLNSLVRSAHTIMADSGSVELVKAMIAECRDDLIRIPKLIESENYIGTKSVSLLKRELGLV